MKTIACRWVALCGLAAAVLVAPIARSADEHYPNHPLQLVIPLAPGTTIDFIGRTYAERLTERLGQTVVVQNRPGAGGTIAAQSVAKATPDGYTLLIVNSQHSINPTLYHSLPFDTLRDFSGVAMIGVAPSVIAVHPSLGVTHLKDFVTLARQKPGQITYGSAGVGTTTHLGAAYFSSLAGISLVHVPYKGAELLTDLLAGRVQSIFVPLTYVLQQIREGKLVGLAMTTREPLREPIALPSVSETVIPGFEYATYYGFVAGAKVPSTILEQLSGVIHQITDEPAIRARFSTLAFFGRHLGPAEFDAYIKADYERMDPVVRAAGASAN